MFALHGIACNMHSIITICHVYRAVMPLAMCKWWEDLPKNNKKKEMKKTHTHTHTAHTHRARDIHTEHRMNTTKRLNMWWCTFITLRHKYNLCVPFKRKLASGWILMKWFIYWIPRFTFALQTAWMFLPFLCAKFQFDFCMIFIPFHSIRLSSIVCRKKKRQTSPTYHIFIVPSNSFVRLMPTTKKRIYVWCTCYHRYHLLKSEHTKV